MDLNLAEAREWLEIVYGDTPGLIHVCGTNNWTGFTCGGDNKIDTALNCIQRLHNQGAEGIYLRATTLRSKPPQDSRGGDDLSFYLPGLWGDIDIAGPGHKTTGTLPPTVEEAMKIVAASGLPEPSHWIHSGGGLYPWWLLERPVEITDLEDFRSLSAGWQHALLRGALKIKYQYGAGVGDLSRVLRIPGTVNRKAGLQRPCTGLEGYAWSGRTYRLQELIDALAAVTPEPPKPSPIEIKMSQYRRDGESPGDEFNRTASWHDILLPGGWQWIRKQGDTWYLRRPGKLSGGHSATLRDGTDKLWVFSEEAQPFQAFRLYDKFGAYATLEHNGDFAAAARELGSKGYGAQRPRTPVGLEDSSWATPARPDVVPLPVPPPTPDSPPVAPAATGLTPKRDGLGLPMYGPDELAGMSWDGISIAQQWVSLHENTFAYVPADSKWLMWDGRRWDDDGRLRHEHSAQRMVQTMLERAKQVEKENPDVGKALVKEARKLTSATQISSLIRNARSDPRVVAVPEDFDKDSSLVTLDNGVFNLETMSLSPHDPSMMLTRKMNASFNPQAPQGRWYRFMQEVLPDPAVRSYLQRVCGYMLTGKMTERVMVLLYGESGTGKTQFLEALKAVMGDFAGVAPASAFQPRQQGYKGPSEDLHKLRGKRLAVQSELDAGSRLNEALVKSIVGADTQSTRPLYGAPVDWQPEYTAFLATNHLPMISSSENAIWNRVKPIEFAEVFINENGQALHPAERSLGRRMAAQEADSILNWLLEGLAAYQEMGLAEPEQVTSWLRKYREDVDSSRQFVKQGPEDGHLVVDENASATVKEVYNSYVTWCTNNGIMPLGMRKFNGRLETAGFVKGKKERGMTWRGLGMPVGEWIVGTQRQTGFRDFRQRE